MFEGHTLCVGQLIVGFVGGQSVHHCGSSIVEMPLGGFPIGWAEHSENLCEVKFTFNGNILLSRLPDSRKTTGLLLWRTLNRQRNLDIHYIIGPEKIANS